MTIRSTRAYFQTAAQHHRRGGTKASMRIAQRRRQEAGGRSAEPAHLDRQIATGDAWKGHGFNPVLIQTKSCPPCDAVARERSVAQGTGMKRPPQEFISKEGFIEDRLQLNGIAAVALGDTPAKKLPSPARNRLTLSVLPGDGHARSATDS